MAGSLVGEDDDVTSCVLALAELGTDFAEELVVVVDVLVVCDLDTGLLFEGFHRRPSGLVVVVVDVARPVRPNDALIGIGLVRSGLVLRALSARAFGAASSEQRPSGRYGAADPEGPQDAAAGHPCRAQRRDCGSVVHLAHRRVLSNGGVGRLYMPGDRRS